MFSRKHEDFDESCDPENPKSLKYEEIEDAAIRIKPFIKETPLVVSKLKKKFAINLYFKLDFLQSTGSFKDRGALNFLHRLTLDRQRVGVITSDVGNFTISLCYYASKFTPPVPVTIVMPDQTNRRYIDKCESLGGQVILKGNNIQEAQKEARELSRRTGTTYVNSHDHPDVLAGHGTLGKEIIHQIPFADAIIVPVGSGGLISAIATAVKHKRPDCLIYGVEPECMPTVFKSLEMGEPLVLPLGSTRAETLRIPHPGCNSFNMNQILLDKMLLVKEEWISTAVVHLLEEEKYIVEGAGACALAAIFGSLVPELKGKYVVCVLTGGNMNINTLQRSIDHSHGLSGRLLKFFVNIKDTTEDYFQLLKLISNVKNCRIVSSSRSSFWFQDEVFWVQIRMLCETQTLDDYLDLKTIITKVYPMTSKFEMDGVDDRRLCACQVRRSLKQKP